MYLNFVMVDYLRPDGTLVNYAVEPSDGKSVIIDRLTDLDRDEPTAHVDTGGFRFYNTDSCEVKKNKATLRNVSLTDDTLAFLFEHINIPVSSGMYHLFLPPQFRLTDIHVVDPYDSEADRPRTIAEFDSDAAIERLDEFDYAVIWDPDSHVQLIRMELRSRHGRFSFVVSGEARVYDPEEDPDSEAWPYVEARERERAVGDVLDDYALNDEQFDDAAKRKIRTDLRSYADWLVLQPNLFGLGVDINEIIRSIDAFRETLDDEE